MDAADKKRHDELIQRAMDLLGDHFCSVQILCTKQQEGITTGFCKGSGNWYARVQSAREFIEADQARTHFAEMPEPPPDETDNWKHQ